MGLLLPSCWMSSCEVFVYASLCVPDRERHFLDHGVYVCTFSLCARQREAFLGSRSLRLHLLFACQTERGAFYNRRGIGYVFSRLVRV